jgi:hypothetical protein
LPDDRPLRALTLPDLPVGAIGDAADSAVGGQVNAGVVVLPPSGALVLVDD